VLLLIMKHRHTGVEIEELKRSVWEGEKLAT